MLRHDQWFWPGLLFLASVMLLWASFANAEVIKSHQVINGQPQQKADPSEQNWALQEQAATTMKEHVNEAVMKLINERRVLMETNNKLNETLKNEREYWAAYVKGLEPPK